MAVKIRIGFAELGRVMTATDKPGPVPYDALRILRELATRHPEHSFWVFSRTGGGRADLPDNVVWPLFDGLDYDEALRLAEATLRDCDRAVVFVNQHTPTSLNGVIPKVHGSGFVTTLEMGKRSCAPVIWAVNQWQDVDSRREPVYLVNDPRSPLRARDLKWPPRQPIIANFDRTDVTKHYRFGDQRARAGQFQAVELENGHWKARIFYAYASFELQVLESPSELPLSTRHDDRADLGFMSNENDPKLHVRRGIIRDWVLARWPRAEVRGQWTAESRSWLGRPDITPLELSDVHGAFQRWRCTLVVPTAGSGWATTHPWAAFAAGCVAFFHPDFDTQDHVLDGATAELRAWLRTSSPEELWRRVEVMRADPGLWLRVVLMQRTHLERRYHATRGGFGEVERRLGLI